MKHMRRELFVIPAACAALALAACSGSASTAPSTSPSTTESVPSRSGSPDGGVFTLDTQLTVLNNSSRVVNVKLCKGGSDTCQTMNLKNGQSIMQQGDIGKNDVYGALDGKPLGANNPPIDAPYAWVGIDASKFWCALLEGETKKLSNKPLTLTRISDNKDYKRMTLTVTDTVNPEYKYKDSYIECSK